MKKVFISLFITLVGLFVLNTYNPYETSTDLAEFKSLTNSYTCHYRSLNCMFQTGNCGIECRHGDELTLTNQSACYPVNNLVLVGFN